MYLVAVTSWSSCLPHGGRSRRFQIYVRTFDKIVIAPQKKILVTSSFKVQYQPLNRSVSHLTIGDNFFFAAEPRQNLICVRILDVWT